MKKFAILLIVTLLSLSLTSVAMAKGGPTVVINGGGIIVNNNSAGGVLPELLSVGGFTAKLKGDNAKGQIQAKTVSADDPTVTLGSIHGRVLCVEELPGDVWEVRFDVTKAAGAAAGLLGLRGSLFVFDGGSPGAGHDFVDENFSPPYDDGCGNRIEGEDFGLEPVVAGNFTVHQ